jgi:DNA-binding response OmpR family regulator
LHRSENRVVAAPAIGPKIPVLGAEHGAAQTGTHVAPDKRVLTVSLKILIVERERHAREGLKAILSAEGHEVDVAPDMWAGFAAIFANPYDLLLLDDNVQAERHDTVTVLDLLRFARRYESNTCAIVITSFDEDAHGYRIEQGVLVVLRKPIELSRLWRELEAKWP